MNEEIWKNIHRYEGVYQVSSLGRIRSVDRYVHNGQKLYWRHGCEIKQWSGNTSAYLCVCLSCNGKSKKRLVHRIVAEHFLSDWDESLEVNHIDGDKFNNSQANLEMCCRMENITHSILKGLKRDYGECSKNAKLTNKDAHIIRELFRQGIQQKDLAQRFRVCKQTICDIVHYKKYKDESINCKN